MTNYNSSEARLNRMMVALGERLEKDYGCRADMYISDVSRLDNDSCYAMLSYAPGLPVPTTEQVIDFIGAQFNGKVRPVLETAKAFPDHSSVLLMLAKYQQTRKIDDVTAMIPVVAGARYLDVEMKDTWDVMVTPDGKKYLRRCSDDDVSGMVADRKQRMDVTAGVAEFTIARAVGSGSVHADVGDTVRCYWQGSVYPDCEVKSVTAGGTRLSVNIPNIGSVTVAREAVVEVQAISKDRANQMKNKLAEYYKKALPDAGYAKELTDELVDEGSSALPNSHWAKPGSIGFEK